VVLKLQWLLSLFPTTFAVGDDQLGLFFLFVVTLDFVIAGLVDTRSQMCLLWSYHFYQLEFRVLMQTLQESGRADGSASSVQVAMSHMKFVLKVMNSKSLGTSWLLYKTSVQQSLQK
jgi:hypothetical protein